jgi:hypothetical protein
VISLILGCLLAVIYRQALHHAARPPDVGVPPPLWKPLFTDWTDASSPPHLLTGVSTVCYRGGQSDELSESQLSTLPSSTTWSSTTGIQKHHKKTTKLPFRWMEKTTQAATLMGKTQYCNFLHCRKVDQQPCFPSVSPRSINH